MKGFWDFLWVEDCAAVLVFGVYTIVDIKIIVVSGIIVIVIAINSIVIVIVFIITSIIIIVIAR